MDIPPFDDILEDKYAIDMYNMFFFIGILCTSLTFILIMIYC